MYLHERIVTDPQAVHGRAHIKGTRVRVSDVLSHLAAGDSEADILEFFPCLTSDDVRACLGYAAAQAERAVLIASR